MKTHRPRFRWLGIRWLAIFVLAAWLGCVAMPGAAWAQKSKKNAGVPVAGPEEQGYALPYFLVVLTLGLGLACVCRPSRRREIQQAAYQQPTDIVHGK